MYPAEFQYFRAGSIAEAHMLLAQHEGAKLLAGGHSLLPLLKLRLASPSALIDIGRVAELKGISLRGSSIRIGALTTHAEIASSSALADACPLLPEAAALIGDPLVRNCGTVGGNIAHADPASDLPTVFLALGARIIASGPSGERTIDARDFFKGMMTTELGDDEILVAIEVPTKHAGQGMAYVKFAHPASRYAVIGAAAVLTMSGGTCKAASVTIGGLVPKATHATGVEDALTGHALTPELIEQAAAKVSSSLRGDVLGDLYASDEYRRAMAPVYVKRAITAAAARAR